MNGLVLVTTVVVVEILTTDGINFSARSANEAGTGLEFTLNEKVNDRTIVKNIIFIFLILAHNVINNYKTYKCKNKSTWSKLAIFN